MRPHRSKLLWVSTTYFAEGLPFMLVRFLSGVYLTDIGLKERYLGFLNFLGIPWNFKFLWAPACDMWGTKKGWLTKIEFIISFGFILIAVLSLFGPQGGIQSVLIDQTDAVNTIVIIVILMSFVSATHDIAIDAYYMEAITDPKEQAGYTGVRVFTYRIAVIFTKSVLVALAGFLIWLYPFMVGGIIMLFLGLFHLYYLPNTQSTHRPAINPKQILSQYLCAFSSYLGQPKIGLILFFVITYKLGDEVLFCMNTAFLLREIKMTKDQVAWVTGIVGTIASIMGSLLSAWALKRFGLKKAVWPLTLGMNINIWAYVWLAWALPDPITVEGIAKIAFIHAYEQFAAGLGNSTLVVYILRTCKPEFKAAHYAIASALASIGGTFLGGFGGILVEEFGYMNLFILAFFASLPSMIALLFIPLDDR